MGDSEEDQGDVGTSQDLGTWGRAHGWGVCTASTERPNVSWAVSRLPWSSATSGKVAALMGEL